MPTSMPSSTDIRKIKISEIIKGNPTRTGEKLFGSTPRNVYAIPLEYLTYNQENTRFLAEAKTFEAEYGRELDVSKSEDYDRIEDYIWEYSKDRNERTILSLLEDGQQKPGVITSAGVVLSGNRRLRLLNEIKRNPNRWGKNNRERLEELMNFEAVVLEDSELTPARLISLETHYQFGEDGKVDYNPIQKYLAAYNHTHSYEMDIKRVAQNFNVKTNEVKKWLEVYDLMIEYLEHTGQNNRFTALEKLEDPFLALNSFLKQLEKHTTSKVRWVYDDVDIEELKGIYYDNLFGGVLGEKSYRDIIKFFQDENIWKEYSSKMSGIDITTLLDINSYEMRYPDLKQDQVAEMRRADFAAIKGEEIKGAFANANFRESLTQYKAMPLTKAHELGTASSTILDYFKGVASRGKTLNEKPELLVILDNAIADIEDIKEIVNR